MTGPGLRGFDVAKRVVRMDGRSSSVTGPAPAASLDRRLYLPRIAGAEPVRRDERDAHAKHALGRIRRRHRAGVIKWNTTRLGPKPGA
jgi:hypothetical protein